MGEQGFAYALKQETRSAHMDTEQVLVQRLKKIKTIEDYAAILKMFYGYFTPLENKINEYLDETALADISERRKSSRLHDDLNALGVERMPDICEVLPSIKNTSHAFGALYVLEGSTLGGEIIVKMLKANSALTRQDNAFSFFYGYGENNKQMWRQFQQALQQHVKDDATSTQVINAATDTFILLKNWMLNYHHATNPY